MSGKLIEFPYQIFTYWLNRKEKRVFLLADSPYLIDTDKPLSDYTVKLMEWGKDNPIRVSALDFVSLIELKKFIPYYPKYTE